MDNKKITAVILTRSGSDYSDEGKQFVASHLQSSYNISQLILLGGEQYNKPSILKDLLEQDPENTYVVLSLPKDIIFIPTENNKNIILMLEKIEDETSWRIIFEMCKRDEGFKNVVNDDYTDL